MLVTSDFSLFHKKSHFKIPVISYSDDYFFFHHFLYTFPLKDLMIYLWNIMNQIINLSKIVKVLVEYFTLHLWNNIFSPFWVHNSNTVYNTTLKKNCTSTCRKFYSFIIIFMTYLIRRLCFISYSNTNFDFLKNFFPFAKYHLNMGTLKLKDFKCTEN